MTTPVTPADTRAVAVAPAATPAVSLRGLTKEFGGCLLYTSDAADE